jgi:hypothetical protein
MEDTVGKEKEKLEQQFNEVIKNVFIKDENVKVCLQFIIMA